MSRLIAGKQPPGEEELALRQTVRGKLLFTGYHGKSCAFLLKEDKLLAVQVIPDASGKIDSIHIGKVKNVVKNIDACFVEIAEKELCFLPMKEARFPFLLNRDYDGRLLEGDELLVQIVRDAQKTKQACVTSHISLANDAFALSIGSDHVGFSGKLEPEQKAAVRQFLEDEGLMYKGHFTWEKYTAVKSASGTLSAAEKDFFGRLISVGLIVRTQAGGMEPPQLESALQGLMKEFQELLHNSLHRTCFTCIKEAPGACEAVLQDIAGPQEYQELLTDDETLYKELSAAVRSGALTRPVRLYQDSSLPLSRLYSLERRMEEALEKRVWLKSGGYLVIEPTEALTVIDVNSGKYSARKTSVQMACQINEEAALEVARQLRLRNLSGMIVVDFINMASPQQEEALLSLLHKAVKNDRQRVHVVDITPLGLVEITRKKELPTLIEQLGNKI